MPKLPPASTRNPAFQSKLEPYREFIRECRAKRWSYPRIAAALQEEHGLSAAASTIFSFVKVRAKRRRLYAPLIAAKLLAPLGKPAPNAPKYFATVDVVAAAQDREWLSQATRALARHWRMKNSRKKSAQSSASFLDAAA